MIRVIDKDKALEFYHRTKERKEHNYFKGIDLFDHFKGIDLLGFIKRLNKISLIS